MMREYSITTMVGSRTPQNTAEPSMAGVKNGRPAITSTTRNQSATAAAPIRPAMKPARRTRLSCMVSPPRPCSGQVRRHRRMVKGLARCRMSLRPAKFPRDVTARASSGACVGAMARVLLTSGRAFHLGGYVGAHLVAFLELTKPRITQLVLLTAAAGFYLGSRGGVDIRLLVQTLIGVALVAAGANPLQPGRGRDVDARMRGTQRRPLPSR